jgi:hypothetical protein
MGFTVGACDTPLAPLGREIAERLLPRAESVMDHTVGSETLTVAGRVETEGEPGREVVGREREVAGIAPRRGPGAPQEPRPDAADVRDEVVTEIATQRQQIGRRFDPRARGDGAVALRGRGQVDGVHGCRVDGTILERSHGSIMTSASLWEPSAWS